MDVVGTFLRNTLHCDSEQTNKILRVNACACVCVCVCVCMHLVCISFPVSFSFLFSLVPEQVSKLTLPQTDCEWCLFQKRTRGEDRKARGIIHSLSLSLSPFLPPPSHTFFLSPSLLYNLSLSPSPSHIVSPQRIP